MLSPEQMAAFQQKMDQGQQEPADHGQGDQGEQGQEQPKDAATKQDQQVDPKGKDQPERQEQRGPIPYDRFQEVARKRREAEDRAKKLEAELEQYRKGQGQQQPQQTAPARPERTFLEELQDLERGKPDGQDDLAERFNRLEGTLIQREAATLLDRTIADAKAQHPDVPEKYFYAAIGQGYENEDGVEMWEQVKREVLGTQSAIKPAATQPAGRVATPPLPRSQPATPPRKPQTMEEAHQAFRKKMQLGG